MKPNHFNMNDAVIIITVVIYWYGAGVLEASAQKVKELYEAV
jgi:hypothetical protein